MIRPEPPAGGIIRDTRTGLVLRNGGAGEWLPLNADTDAGPLPWSIIDSWGDLELLVPIPYVTTTAATGDQAAVMQHVVESVLNPVGAMMMQLAQAAGAGVTAVVAEAYLRGRESAHLELRQAAAGDKTPGEATHG